MSADNPAKTRDTLRALVEWSKKAGKTYDAVVRWKTWKTFLSFFLCIGVCVGLFFALVYRLL